MKLLFVTYRWGDDIVGGAEIHHRRLVRDLLALGHEVKVWTTTGRDLSPAAHWATEWSTGYPEGSRDENGVRVRRFKLDAAPPKALRLGAKYVQRQVEREWESADPCVLARIAAQQPEARGPWVHLLEGWHHVELGGDSAPVRWTSRTAHLAVFPATGGELQIAGNAPRAMRVTLGDHAGNDAHRSLQGDFCESFPISASDLLTLRVETPWRPLTDHRTLGLYIRSVRWKPHGAAQFVEANLWNDHRAIGRRAPAEWWDLLWTRAERRPPRYSKLFDWLRGPRSKSLAAALRNPPAGFDAVLAANLPWSVVPMVARECPLPLLAMALWHIEDDFYYWSHYIDALKHARLVLANTPYSAEQFFRPRGIRAEFVGPGIDVPPEPVSSPDARAWKHELGIADGEAVVLSVSRKSPEKRYDVIADAIERLNARGRRVRFVFIGPDADKRAVPSHTLYLGRVDDEALDRAYRCCDVLALMSDSESFGMVLAEAWMRAKPVIANAICGPAASLIADGEDGLLAHDAASLADAIASLLDDPSRATRMGETGKGKALREFTQRAATKRFLAAAERALAP